MKKLKQEETEEGEVLSTVQYDVETMSQVITHVKGNGFTPQTVLVEKFGPEKTTQAIAVLFRDMRMFREVRRPWADGKEVLGYEWANPKFSKPVIRRMPKALQMLAEFQSPVMPRYGDFEEISVLCRWTNSIQGAVPIKDENSDPLHSFERDNLGNLLIVRYCQRAMAAKALPIIGKGASIAQHILFSFIKLDKANTTVEITEHGVVENGQGKGLRKAETVRAGQEFLIKAYVPTTELSIDEYLRMLRVAGEYVGLSPARSAGFGDFEIVRVVEGL